MSLRPRRLGISGTLFRPDRYFNMIPAMTRALRTKD